MKRTILFRIFCIGAACSLLLAGCTSGEGSSAIQSEGAPSNGVSSDQSGDNMTSEVSSAVSSSTASVNPVTPPKAEGKTYYVSNSSGKDSNNGTSEKAPFKTLTKAAGLLKEGDKLCLKSGDIWEEGVTFTASGSADAPILITSYGSGARPRIKNNKGAAITLQNCDGYFVDGLSFYDSAIGILAKGEGSFAGEYLVVQNCDFSDGTFSQPDAGSSVNFQQELTAGSTGVVVASKNTKTGWKNVTVNRCVFVGISVGVASYATGDFSKLSADSSRQGAIFENMTLSGCTARELSGSAFLLNNVKNLTLSNNDIAESGHYGTGFGADGAIRLAFCQKATLSNQVISATYAYADHASGSGILLAGGNDDITIKNCDISNNVGPALRVSAEALSSKANGTVTAEGCTFADNNTAKLGGNTAFDVASGKGNVSLKNCRIILQNNQQEYKKNLSVSGGSVINAVGKAIAGSSSGVTATTLQIGIAQAKITPEEPIQLQGYSHHPSDPNYSYEFCDPSTDFYDDIYARVAVLADTKTGNKILIITFDMCQMREGYEVPEGTFAAWAKAAGVPEENVIPIPEHNHQSVSVLKEKYIDRVTAACKEAAQKMKTVKMGYTIEHSDAGANRRPNLQVSQSLPQDDRLTVYNFTNVEDGSLVTTFFHYPMHNTSIGYNRINYWKMLTSELTGLAAKSVASSLKLDSAFHIQGFGGDVGPNMGNKPSGDYETVKTYAKKMADQVVAQSKNTPTQAITAGLNFKKVTHIYGGYTDYPIVMTAFRLGKIGFFGLNMEGFSETAANIIAHSPFEHTMVSGLVLGSSGYAPTVAAFKDGLGGYEVKDACNFPSLIENFLLEKADALLDEVAGKGIKELKISSVSGTSAADSSNAIEKVLDGKGTTKYVPSSQQFVLTADLGSVKTLERFVIHFGDYSKREVARKYTVWASEDASFANPILIGYETNNVTPQHGYQTSVKARYIRVVCTEGYAGAYDLAVYNISAYGK